MRRSTRFTAILTVVTTTIRLRFLRTAALVLVTIACVALPAHTPAQASYSAAHPAAGPATANLAATLSGDITTTVKGKVVVLHQVQLSVSTWDQAVVLGIGLTTASNPTYSSYEFHVPATDLTIADQGQTTISSTVPYYAVLDTKGDLGT